MMVDGIAVVALATPAAKAVPTANAKLKPEVVVAFPVSPYTEERDGALKIAGTRVSLASVVIGFQEGESPEQIVQAFPTLTLAQVYGAIAYYLENEKLINDYLAEVQREFERTVPPLSQTNPELFARLEAARLQKGSKRT